MGAREGERPDGRGGRGRGRQSCFVRGSVWGVTGQDEARGCQMGAGLAPLEPTVAKVRGTR